MHECSAMTPEREYCGTPMPDELPVAEDAYRQFKRVLFGDIVNDPRGVHEAWWEANGEFPDLALSQRLALAERAVHELLERGLVTLSRGGWDESPEPVPREEYEALLRDWKAWNVRPDMPVVWMLAKPQDEADLEAIFDSL